jgi:hypothetical protein
LKKAARGEDEGRVSLVSSQWSVSSGRWKRNAVIRQKRLDENVAKLVGDAVK